MGNLYRKRLSEIGLVSTNCDRVDAAVKQLHEAFCHMDGGQGIVFATVLEMTVADLLDHFGLVEELAHRAGQAVAESNMVASHFKRRIP